MIMREEIAKIKIFLLNLIKHRDMYFIRFFNFKNKHDDLFILIEGVANFDNYKLNYYARW